MDIELIKATIKRSLDEALEPYEYDDEMDGYDFNLGASGPMFDDGQPEAWVGVIVDILSNELHDLQKRQKVVLGSL
jgi:hypothetical protein